MIEHDGVRMSVADWARRLGVAYLKAYRLLVEQGKAIDQLLAARTEAINTPCGSDHTESSARISNMRSPR